MEEDSELRYGGASKDARGGRAPSDGREFMNRRERRELTATDEHGWTRMVATKGRKPARETGEDFQIIRLSDYQIAALHL